MPVVLGVLAGAFFVFTSTPTYKSTASLWVDTAPPLASTVGAGPSDPLTTPPAAAEQGILTELLDDPVPSPPRWQRTRCSGSPWGTRRRSGRTPRHTSRLGQVVPTVAGQQLLQISYLRLLAGRGAKRAGAVVTQLRDYTDDLTAEHNQAAIAYDSEQAKLAQAGTGGCAEQRQHLSGTAPERQPIRTRIYWP